MGEFDLIARYFKRPPKQAHVALGVGDDCALLQPGVGMHLAITSDMLVEGRHFLSTVDPFRLGHKSLAVNLSDLAACGARPRAFTLALSLPHVDESWLEGFSAGLFALADQHGCELVGGDTTRGPLNICITAFGEVPRGRALLRSGARAGDDIYVSGTLGDARLALEAFRGTLSLPQDIFAAARDRLEQPTPRIELGLALRDLATAAIDISDGLLGDLGHILKASHVGATIRLPDVLTLMASAFSPEFPQTGGMDLPDADRLRFVLSGGDDYELLFTAPPAAADAVKVAARQARCPVTCIGQIDAAPGARLADASGNPQPADFASFDHFA
ncbi:MAG: thiamine-phosphate kinase [Comamonadaceae bacterium]|nr:MAG: thiamine-phosphate kinase [Comamonadaceae bacterium]